MNNDTRLLGQAMMLNDAADRHVIVTLLRALLIDASAEKIQVIRDLMANLRVTFESTVASAEDEPTQAQARVALKRFEDWDTDIDHMLHQKTKSSR